VGRANVLRGAAARALGVPEGHVVLVRPEQLRFGTTGSGLTGVVTERRYTGAAAFYQVTTDAGDRVEVLAEPDAARVGERVTLGAARRLAFRDGAA
jgi:hypothetical protein